MSKITTARDGELWPVQKQDYRRNGARCDSLVAHRVRRGQSAGIRRSVRRTGNRTLHSTSKVQRPNVQRWARGAADGVRLPRGRELVGPVELGRRQGRKGTYDLPWAEETDILHDSSDDRRCVCVGQRHGDWHWFRLAQARQHGHFRGTSQSIGRLRAGCWCSPAGRGAIRLGEEQLHGRRTRRRRKTRRGGGRGGRGGKRLVSSPKHPAGHGVIVECCAGGWEGTMLLRPSTPDRDRARRTTTQGRRRRQRQVFGSSSATGRIHSPLGCA